MAGKIAKYVTVGTNDLNKAKEFFLAEDYHQCYIQKKIWYKFFNQQLIY